MRTGYSWRVLRLFSAAVLCGAAGVTWSAERAGEGSEAPPLGCEARVSFLHWTGPATLPGPHDSHPAWAPAAVQFTEAQCGIPAGVHRHWLTHEGQMVLGTMPNGRPIEVRAVPVSGAKAPQASFAWYVTRTRAR